MPFNKVEFKKKLFMRVLGTFEVCIQTVTCHNSDHEKVIIIIIIIIIIIRSSSLLCIMYKHINICIFVGD